MLKNEFTPYQQRFDEKDGSFQVAFPINPDTYTTLTGTESAIYHRANIFFDQVLGYIGFNDFTRKNLSKREFYELNLPGGQSHENQFIGLLIARDKLLASVIARRDDQNYWQVTSSHHLTEGLVDSVREYMIDSPMNTMSDSDIDSGNS